jgi:general stress protein 26
MRTDITSPTDVELRLWEDLESHHIGMLMPLGEPTMHAQPMTAFPERASRQLWFFTRTETELARHIGGGAYAMFTLQHHDLHACIGGHLHLEHDEVRLERYWNAVVAAWYPEGRNDPALTMLRFDCHDAQVWLSEAGPVKFAWEIAKANATHQAPDLGGRAHLRFH